MNGKERGEKEKKMKRDWGNKTREEKIKPIIEEDGELTSHEKWQKYRNKTGEDVELSLRVAQHGQNSEMRQYPQVGYLGMRQDQDEARCEGNVELSQLVDPSVALHSQHLEMCQSQDTMELPQGQDTEVYEAIGQDQDQNAELRVEQPSQLLDEMCQGPDCARRCVRAQGQHRDPNVKLSVEQPSQVYNFLKLPV